MNFLDKFEKIVNVLTAVGDVIIATQPRGHHEKIEKFLDETERQMHTGKSFTAREQDLVDEVHELLANCAHKAERFLNARK